jgi:hypothetical protein
MPPFSSLVSSPLLSSNIHHPPPPRAQSRNRRKLLHFLSSVSPYIFIPFFTLTGCNIKLDVVAASMSFAPIIVVVRMLTIFLGSFLGGHVTGMPAEHKTIMWMGLISQVCVCVCSQHACFWFLVWGLRFCENFSVVAV